MNKNPLVNTRALFSAVRNSAILFAAFSFSHAMWAQPANNTWDSTMSFNGTGTLKVSDTSYVNAVNGGVDPLLSISMTGSGVNTATAHGAAFDITSAFNNVLTTVYFPNSVPTHFRDGTSSTFNPFSVTQPVIEGTPGPDPGFTLEAPPATLPGNPSTPPFYGLFPPPSGQLYNGSISIPGPSTAAQHPFSYIGDSTVTLFVTLTGAVTLTLGDSPTVTVTPDPSITGDDYYLYSYANTVLAFTATIGENDPTLDFTGTLNLETVAPAPGSTGGVAAPDSSPGIVGVSVLLGLCALGARQKVRAA